MSSEKEDKKRWSHDLYNDHEQRPKTRDELILAYGYDIRNEEWPPKRRGVLYEHNDRTAEGEEEGEKRKKEKQPPRQGGKGCDGKKRWSHDLYNDHEQRPKTRDELIQAYGYDIRNEEEASKACRRHGKGPNRYERICEEDSVYNRASSKTGWSTPATNRLKKFAKKESEFPASSTIPQVARTLEPDDSIFGFISLRPRQRFCPSLMTGPPPPAYPPPPNYEHPGHLPLPPIVSFLSTLPLAVPQKYTKMEE